MDLLFVCISFPCKIYFLFCSIATLYCRHDLPQNTNPRYRFFVQLLGQDHVLYDAETLAVFSKDHTEDLIYSPEIVLFPANNTEISSILIHCNEHHIPVTPRGAGTGLSGAALPIYGGIVLSTKD